MRERGPGRWQLRAYEGVDPITGKDRYRTRAFQGTKRQAQSALAALVTEVDAGVVAPSAKTVATLLEEWLAHIEHLGRSPSTLYGYGRLVAQLPDGFKALPLKKVTPKVVDDLYRFLGQTKSRSPATVLRFHTVLRAAFAQAVRWGWIERNPIDRVTPPRVHRHEIEPPPIEDVLRVLKRATASRNPENALVFRLLAATGCRRGEACALQWHDVDFASEPVQVLIRRAVLEIEKKLIVQGTKTHAVRNVGLDEETSRLLREHRDRAVERGTAAGVPPRPTDFVFERAPGSGEPLPPDRIGQAWYRLCRELGVKARLHDLRHLQASLLLDAGEAVTTVAARLGHRDTSTTLKVYGHLMPGADTRAAGIVGAAFRRPTDEARDHPEA
ncbi:MAG TPA: site-specific integrase [Acidimicrobiales bacterium]|jgi:integrase|nr:site-specific integrase [Acidimicrobiales bacterium]